MLSDLWQGVNRILAVRLDNIGDVIMLGPALRAVKQSLPHAEITLMASPAGSQVAPMLPWIHDVTTIRAIWQDVSGALPFDPKREEALFSEIRKRNFDAALIFTSFSQSPYPPAYMAYMAGIPIRAGQAADFGGALLTHWFRPHLREGHQVDRNLHLVASLGFPVVNKSLELQVPEKAQIQAKMMLSNLGIEPEAPFIVLAPGASCAARRYSPDRFAKVARIMARQADMPVVIIGSQREAGLIAPALDAVDGKLVVSLVGQTNLVEAAAVIERAALIIANNSASLHFADAFRVPMVIMYSGTELESQWKPRSAPAKLLRRDTFCSPCHLFDCPYAMECLDISPEEVAEASLSLLSQASSENLSNIPSKPALEALREG